MAQRWESRQQCQRAHGQGGFGGRKPDMWVSVVSVGGVVMGGRLSSHAEMGRGALEAGRRGGKQPETPFCNLNSFSIDFLDRWE
jgi:hypothetical protein